MPKHYFGDEAVQDLLGRQPAQTEIKAITRLPAGKRVLDTGGGGEWVVIWTR